MKNFYRSSQRVPIGGIYKLNMDSHQDSISTSQLGESSRGSPARSPSIHLFSASSCSKNLDMKNFYRSSQRVPIGGIYKLNMDSYQDSISTSQ